MAQPLCRLDLLGCLQSLHPHQTWLCGRRSAHGQWNPMAMVPVAMVVELMGCALGLELPLHAAAAAVVVVMPFALGLVTVEVVQVQVQVQVLVPVQVLVLVLVQVQVNVLVLVQVQVQVQVQVLALALARVGAALSQSGNQPPHLNDAFGVGACTATRS